ncbi:MAG: NAD(P)-dependent methylenetetrahydromethanopterin dehydrogenase [Pseudomonadota bacterium]
MDHPHLLHIFSPTKNVSPFDINMAYEAQFDAVIPHCGVALEEIHGLTQDTIFSRSRQGVKRTGIFIGGRDLGLALDMLEAARAAMVPPFLVSVMADPSGAITTAAAMVALVENRLAPKGGLKGRRVHVFGGTGPVGTCAAMLAARNGAQCAIVSHQGLEYAERAATTIGARYGVSLRGADGSSAAAIAQWLPGSEIVMSAAKAGVQVLSKDLLRIAEELTMLADANAVPPAGIEGVGVNDSGVALETAAGRTADVFGALAIGDVKYRLHTSLLQSMYGADKPIYIAEDEAFESARAIVDGRH